MTFNKFALVICASTVLAGCNQASLPDMVTTGSVFGATKAPAYDHAIAEKRPVQEAFLKLPSGTGSVIDLTETRYANGVEQLIVYQGDFDTSGENAARVRMVVHNIWPKPTGPTLELARPSTAALRREMRQVLPNVSMRISNELHRNAYGPFGYALGRARGNVTCMYGWQEVQGEGKSAGYTLPIFNKPSDKPELSIRLRVCRENARADQMVALMRRIRIEADPSAALQRRSVSWGSNVNNVLPMEMESFDAGGYQSSAAEPIEDDFVAPAAPKKKPSKKTVKRKTVKASTPKTQYAQVPKPATASPDGPLKTTGIAPDRPVKSASISTRSVTTGGFPAVPLPD